MIESTAFTEEQRFRQPWLIIPMWIYFIAMLALCLYCGYREFVLDSPWGGRDFAKGGLFSVFAVHVLVSVVLLFFFRKMKLTVKVRGDGIHIRYFPFHFKDVVIMPADIKSQRPVTYHPIKEYGGWGIRRGWGKNKKCYNVMGNRGVLLEYKNGGTLLIGSQNPEMLSEAIGSIGIGTA